MKRVEHLGAWRRVVILFALLLTALPAQFLWSSAASAATGYVQGTMAMARNVDGRIEIFGTDSTGGVWHRWQDSAGSGTWTPWVQFDGPRMTSLAAEANADGRIELFGLDAGGAIYHRWQWSGGWSPWYSMDGTLVSLAVARNSDGRLELFGTNAAQDVWHRVQVVPGTPSASQFGQWSKFDGFLSTVAAEANADGRLALIGTNSAGQIWQRRQAQPGDWSGTIWAPVDGQLSSIALARGPKGRLELGGSTSDDLVIHRTQASRNSTTWNGWEQFTGTLRSVAMEANSDDSLVVAGVKANGEVVEQHQVRGGWSGWQSLSGPLWVPPAVDTHWLASDTDVPGDRNEHVLIDVPLSLRAGETRRVMGELWAMLKYNVNSSIDDSVAVRCVDSAGIQPAGSITEWAETSLLPGKVDQLRPAMVFTAPATGVYHCRLLASTSDSDVMTAFAGWTTLKVTTSDDMGAHQWIHMECDSEGKLPTCVYLGDGMAPRTFRLFDQGVTPRQPVVVADNVTEVSAYANVEVTTCGHTASCAGYEFDYSSSTVVSHVEVVQLDRQGFICQVTSSPDQTDIIGIIPHHYNIVHRFDHVPVSAACGRSVYVRVVLTWVAGNPVKIDGTRPDPAGTQVNTGAFLFNSAVAPMS